jgi:TfoX/Sxy family transcriptional regulator of competence genes
MKKATKATIAASGSQEDADFARIARAFAGDPEVTCGKMFSSNGLKVNGKIFAMLVKGKFVAKLPKSRVDELVTSGCGEYFDPGHGRLMKEWVCLHGREPSWLETAHQAHRFVKVAALGSTSTAKG